MNEQYLSRFYLQKSEAWNNLRSRFFISSALVLALILIGASGCQKTPESRAERTAQEKHLTIPHTLVAEHEALHRDLQETISFGGETGKEATLVADRLRPHFEKEERYALPPLTLLGPLSQDRFDAEMGDVMKLSETMSAELPQMLNDHKAITEALDRMVDAARKENQVAAIEFSERLRQHARTEEEILYPTAIVVGKYLKLRIEREAQPKR